MKPVARVSLQLAIRGYQHGRGKNGVCEKEPAKGGRLTSWQGLLIPTSCVSMKQCRLAFLSLHSFLSFIPSPCLLFLLFVLSLILLIRPLFLNFFFLSFFVSFPLSQILYFHFFLSLLPSYYFPFFPFRFWFIIHNTKPYRIWYSITSAVDIVSYRNRRNKQSIIRIKREPHLKGIECMLETGPTQTDM